MRDGWRDTTLGDLCTITKGTSPTQKTLPGPYPLIVTGPEPLSSDSFQFHGEAVCVPLVSSTGHGHASLKRVHYASGKFAVANIIAACVPRAGAGVDARFLFHYLQHFKDAEIVTRMKGTANVSLSITNLATVPVALPPLDEQWRIVDLIAAVDNAVEAAEAEAAMAFSAKKSIADGIVGDATLLGELLTDIVAGASPSARARPPRDGEVGVLKVSAIGDERFHEEESKALDSSTSMPDRARVRTGDLLMTRASGAIDRVGVTCVVHSTVGNLFLSDKTFRLIPDTGKTTGEWLNTMLRSSASRAQIEALATGSHMRNLAQAKARMISLPLPELREQERQAAAFAELSRATGVARETAAALRTLRSNLLTVLLSGEHEIPSSYDALLGEAA